MSAVPEERPVSLSLLAVPESTPTALYGFYEVFSSVGVAWAELTGEPSAARRMAPRIVATSREPFACALGIPISPQVSLAEAGCSDVVIVGDLSLSADIDPRGRWPTVTEWLRQQFEEGAIVCSVCTGSILLADAGLLDGHEVTSHWAVTDLFRTCYPAVILRAERILVPSGPEHRIVTSGGATSWEDLALYLVARFCGEAEAVRIARIFLFGDRSEGQLPYAAMARPRRHEDAVIRDCQVWIAEHYTAQNPVASLCQRSGLTERTFNRRFKAATGYAPVEYIQALRIEEAKHLLERTSEPTDVVASRVGYEDPTFFRRLFKRRTGVTPARYRRRFQLVGRTAGASRG